MVKRVGIILVNYGDYAQRFLGDCRDSLRGQTYPRGRLQVYIVDNASSPQSRDYLRRHYPEAVVIPRPDGNYAAANNAGLRQAREDACDYLVVANMDTSFAPTWLGELVRVADNHPEAGLVQSKILLYPRTPEESGRPRLFSLGCLIHFLGFGFNNGYRQPDRAVPGAPEIPGFACGCALLLKPEVVAAVGAYNEGYYMYHEDLELGLRVRLAGYKILLAPRSVVYHKFDVSRSLQMSYYAERNRYITLFAFYRPAALVTLLPALLLAEAAVSAYWCFTGRGREKLKVYRYFCQPQTWRDIREQRETLRRLTRVPEGDIIKGFAGRIEFQENPHPLLDAVLNPCLAWYWRLVRGFLAS